MKQDIVDILDRQLNTFTDAKPFLKWAGGKTGLIGELYKRLPWEVLKERKIGRYIEPFVGGGAFYFFLKGNIKIEEAIIMDLNRDLIMSYKVVRDKVDDLINELKVIQREYLRLSEDNRKEFYYKVRDEYNNNRLNDIKKSAYLIFLNKTCFNGLYRINKEGKFNVPFGKYKNPTICDEYNLIQVSKALENTEIICADFEESKKYISKNTLVYLDPPYRPLNHTSNFTSYTKEGFNDDDQIRLSTFFKEMNKKEAFLILSNSDTEDGFFYNLYKDFIIDKVKANRYINSIGSKRKGVNELIIRNYRCEPKNE